MIEDDDWEAPESMWQVLQEGGYVHNLTEGDYTLMMATTNSLSSKGFYFGNDIYGDEVCFNLDHVVSIKHWTKRGSDRYRKFHEDDDRDY